jgi:hypothetical protein
VVNYVTIRKASELTGYTENAIRSKVADGTWLEGVVWRRAPDNRILISLAGYEAWVEDRVSAPQTSRRHRALGNGSQSER